MTELERQAMLGNKGAQDACTAVGIMLPCPFCGMPAKLSNSFGSYYVRCTFCDATSRLRIIENPAIRDWNTRDAVMKNLSLVCERCKHNEDCIKNHNSCTGFSDFEPKVREDVQGSWEWFDEEHGTPATGWDRDWGWRCSHCKNTLDDEYDDPDNPPKFNFCPNCGARMVRSK